MEYQARVTTIAHTSTPRVTFKKGRKTLRQHTHKKKRSFSVTAYDKNLLVKSSRAFARQMETVPLACRDEQLK
jgi:hypothetical protein